MIKDYLTEENYTPKQAAQRVIRVILNCVTIDDELENFEKLTNKERKLIHEQFEKITNRIFKKYL